MCCVAVVMPRLPIQALEALNSQIVRVCLCICKSVCPFYAFAFCFAVVCTCICLCIIKFVSTKSYKLLVGISKNLQLS